MSAKLIASLTAVVAFALPAASVHAATYISKLEYSQNGYQTPAFGTVKIEEINPNRVDLTVEFGNLVDLIVDTGGHFAFTFNLSDAPDSTVSNLSSGFTYEGEGSFQNSPFGTFSNAISCCGQGASNGLAPSLKFSVNNTSGITFLGPTGNKFVSNTTGSAAGFTGGWWFAVDTYDAGRPDDANTFTVAARDVTEVTGVPEPSTWAMMIIGFGAAGAVLRRRSAALA